MKGNVMSCYVIHAHAHDDMEKHCFVHQVGQVLFKSAVYGQENMKLSEQYAREAVGFICKCYDVDIEEDMEC